MEKPIEYGGEYRVVEALVGRRKLKSSFEYEVKWRGLADRKNAWLPREQLDALGFQKLIADQDAEEATRAGLLGPGAKEFTSQAVVSFLGDFGLDAEFAAHSAIRGLSGGQKVKVVLAAACWTCPHVLILDEPTNFLDRDSLGALARGLREFPGGVVIISHNSEFTSEVCDETWTVANHAVAVSRPERLAAVTERATVSVFLKRDPSQKSLAPLEGDDLDAAIKEAEALKAAKKEAAKEKKAAKEEARKLKFARNH